jgi:translin
MSEFEKALISAADRFAEAEKSREKAIRMSREIIRSSKRVIHSAHNGQIDNVETEKMKELARALVSDIKEEPSLGCAGPASDALSEYAEAVILGDIIFENRIPSFEDLSIDEGSWILGLADVVGELRRVVLKKLMTGDLDTATSVFETMEYIVQSVLMFDVPDAIIPLRRKQDIARGVMERTRSDVATAVVMSKI